MENVIVCGYCGQWASRFGKSYFCSIECKKKYYSERQKELDKMRAEKDKKDIARLQSELGHRKMKKLSKANSLKTVAKNAVKNERSYGYEVVQSYLDEQHQSMMEHKAMLKKNMEMQRRICEMREQGCLK